MILNARQSTTWIRSYDPSGFDAKLFTQTRPIDLVPLIICFLIPPAIQLSMNWVTGVKLWVHGRRRQSVDKQGLISSEAAKDGHMPLPDLKDLDLKYREKLAGESATVEGDGKSANVYFTHLRSILAGVSIASVCLPDAISFSFLAGTSPLNGIWAGVIMSLCSATVGGRPGMISSASGATAIILARVKADGLNHSEMAMAVIIAGIVQGLCAVFQLARFVYLVPHSVIIGFVNGLAVVIFRSQLRQFYTEGGTGPMVDTTTLWGMLATAALAIITTLAYPRIPYVSKYLPLPPAFVALVVCFAFAYAVEPWLPPRTLVKVAGQECFMGGIHVIPHWFFPPPEMRWTSHETWSLIIPIGIRFGLAGLIETILTELLIDQITETQGSTARESFAQSLGNLVSGCFGLQGGCALVGQSLMNVANGGVSRVAGVATSMTLLASVVLLSTLIGMIPVACLMGLIFLITFQMFNWGSFNLCWRLWKADTLGTRLDATVIVVVTAVTIIEDLATAVIIGVCVASVGFAWDSTRRIEFEKIDDGDTCTFKLHGKLFFASALRFQKLFSPAKVTQPNVIVDFTSTSCLDFSAINAIETLRDRFQNAGKNIQFKAIPDDFIKYLPSDMKFVDTTLTTVDAGPLKELPADSTELVFPVPAPIEGVKSRSKAVLQMTDVSFQYPGKDEPTIVNVSVAVSQSSRVEVIGASGAGKSTAIKLLVGEQKPTEGQVWKAPGLRLAYLAEHAFSSLEKHAETTPTEYIMWRFADCEDKECTDMHEDGEKTRVTAQQLTQQSIEKYFMDFGVSAPSASQTKIGQLSDDVKVKVVLAASMWQSPHILIFDKPASYLDGSGLAALKMAIRDYKGGVLIVSDGSELFDKMATEKWIIQEGRLRIEGLQGKEEPSV